MHLRVEWSWMAIAMCLTIGSTSRVPDGRAFIGFIAPYNTQACATVRASVDIHGCASHYKLDPRRCEVPAQNTRAYFDKKRSEANRPKDPTTTTTTTTTKEPTSTSTRPPPAPSSTGQADPPSVYVPPRRAPPRRRGRRGAYDDEDEDEIPGKPREQYAVPDSRAYTPTIEQTGLACKLEVRPVQKVITYNAQDMCCEGEMPMCYGFCESYSWMTGEYNHIDRCYSGCMDTSLKPLWVFFTCTNGCYFFEKVFVPRSCKCMEMRMRDYAQQHVIKD